MTTIYWIIGVIFILYLIRYKIRHISNGSRLPKHFTHHSFSFSKTMPTIISCSKCGMSFAFDTENFKEFIDTLCPGEPYERPHHNLRQHGTNTIRK